MASSKRTWKQSAPCNVDLLIQLRQRKGWTQKQLGKATGFSERLVNKAESGRPIATATIHLLAKALSTDEDPISAEDLVCDMVAVAKEFMAAIHQHQRQILPAIRHILADDVVFHLVGDPQMLPFAGIFHGMAEVEQFFDRLFSIVEVPANHDHEAGYCYVAQGKDVMIWGQSWLHPIGAPLEMPIQVTHRLSFCSGKIKVFEGVYDTLQAAKVLGTALKLES